MKIWLRKLFVSLVAVMTLGLYIPQAPLESEASDVETASEETAFSDKLSQQLTVEDLTDKAKEQTFMKLGPRIKEKVEEDMVEIIFPEIEAVIESCVDVGDVPVYEISESPAAGYGEKIFNLTNTRSGEELARFHVRRDLRPGEGYWFNFHYHVKEDGYENHHPLGEIYWDKNTPPKWMS
ncbi:YpjP family protein [Salimicrobium salexigens]|uniref:YpjP-like protein n=1 Tax=Salimicrobium salexigens TaxID=908941 RepID=A0ABY1KUR3_9BACI|nr:YpjP family protein [Salimicrobium salexigens]SIS81377.1 YpjP-like protein [Salimicrobium salexigens]